MTKYKCLRCKAEVFPNDLHVIGKIQCPNCSYRILVKERPAVIRKVLAR